MYSLIHHLSPQQNWKVSFITAHICPCCIQQSLFLLSLKKKKRTKRKKGGKNRKEKSYLTNLQRLSPDNWAWNEASCLLFAKVMHDSWLGIRQGAGVQCRVSGFPQSWLLQSHFKENAFLVECLIIFAAKGMTAKITNSEKNPRKTSLLQPRWFCSH